MWKNKWKFYKIVVDNEKSLCYNKKALRHFAVWYTWSGSEEAKRGRL